MKHPLTRAGHRPVPSSWESSSFRKNMGFATETSQPVLSPVVADRPSREACRFRLGRSCRPPAFPCAACEFRAHRPTVLLLEVTVAPAL